MKMIVGPGTLRTVKYSWPCQAVSDKRHENVED